MGFTCDLCVMYALLEIISETVSAVQTAICVNESSEMILL